MAEWTYELLDETEADLCKLFSDREVLIREGFDNHRNDKYASAIVLLLSQADGICLDLLGEIFFKVDRNKNVPAVSEVIDNLGVDAFAKITLHPILIKSGINATDKQVSNGEYPNSPHRHAILHGRSTNYASELNSLKIISFVGYMGGVVRDVIEEAKKESVLP